ncbi:MAG: hypothetical protein V4547_17190 [Bacteroidota bacterium]
METNKELLYKKLNALRLEVDSSIVDDIKKTVDEAFKENCFTNQDIITAFDSGAYAGSTKTNISGHEYFLNKYGSKINHNT